MNLMFNSEFVCNILEICISMPIFVIADGDAPDIREHNKT